MGHQRPHKGEDAGYNNGDWEPQRQLDLKRNVKQSNKPFGNFTPCIVASGQNEKYNPPKPGEPLTVFFQKTVENLLR